MSSESAEESEDDVVLALREEQKLLNKFKAAFRAHLTASSQQRISRQPVKINRRLDSLARLLEVDMTCAAVYYDPDEKKIFIATNTIHENSRPTNHSIRSLKRVMALVANHEASMAFVMDELAEIITLNLKQEERFIFNRIKKENLLKIVKDLLENLFSSGKKTKDWRTESMDNMPAEMEGEVLPAEYNKFISRISRVSRDLIKIRQFLLFASHSRLAEAVNKSEFSIIKAETKKVHAEQRAISHKLVKNPAQSVYVGISKLCCGHCGLSVAVVNARYPRSLFLRGQHGQAFDWITPSYITDNPNLFKDFMGEVAYACYKRLSAEFQQKAIDFVQTKESSGIKENARQGRNMQADSSSSDEAFGNTDSGTEEDRAQFTFAETMLLRDIRAHYKGAFKALRDIGISTDKILRVYKEDTEKFIELSSQQAVSLMRHDEDWDAEDIFDKLAYIYNRNQRMFFDLISEEGYEGAREFGFQETIDTYVGYNDRERSSEGEEVDVLSLTMEKLTHENRPDYSPENSDNSREDSENSENSRRFSL